MKLVRMKRTPGVYVNFKDRTGRRKSESLTVDGLSPRQALTLFVRLYREHQRKAAG